MTQALCLRCGSTKFGALNPCMACGGEATGNVELDIAFSDHYMSYRTLELLGTVIQAINEATDDPDLRPLAFILYVTDNHPSVLQITSQSPLIPQARELLGGLTLPVFTVEPGIRNSHKPDEDAQPPPTKRKPWWRWGGL